MLNGDVVQEGTMPRVVPEYKEKARSRILDVAAAEFSAKGYRKTTMDDIAKRIGVSKGALYQYFDSKEGLLAALGERLVTELSGQVEILFREDAHLDRVSEDAFDSMYRMVQSWCPNLVMDLLYEVPDSAKIRRMMRKHTDEIAARLAVLLDERKKSGEIRDDVDTVAVALGFITLQRGHTIFLSLGAPESQVRRSWDETTRAILAGIRR